MKLVAGTAVTAEAVPISGPASPAVKGEADTQAAASAADVRLVIEENGETGSFIYKTVDRTTGEVILQLPREEVLKSILTGEYSAGDVVKARA